MGLDILFSNSAQNQHHFMGFKQGDEKSIQYFFDHAYQSLIRYGARLVDDEFAVQTVVQEAMLKAWDFRGKMESMFHIYCFIRMNVKWQLYTYLKNPGNGFHRRLVREGVVDFYSDNRTFFDEQETKARIMHDEELLDSVYRVIPYLPPQRKTIMTLYFKYGFSYKQIARRFASSNQTVSMEIQKGLEQLKKIIHTRKTLETPILQHRKENTAAAEGLSGELLQIFRYRYENKMSFEAIAEKMRMTVPYIQQQYIQAHVFLKRQKGLRK